MKKEILDLLIKNTGHYVSGEELSERFQVSRTAIWKHINSLKQAGYVIESLPRQGYSLKLLPDILTAEEISLSLMTRQFGRSLHVYDMLSSTNDLAKNLAGEGAPEGTLVLADQQVSGRGRMGRHWESTARTGLWMTLILRPDLEPSLAAQIIFVAAVGVCKALRELTGLDVRIKWPNDLLIDGKKVTGILAEMSAEFDMLNYVVIGIGINVNHDLKDFPRELRGKAASLRLASGHCMRRIEVLQKVLLGLEETYTEFSKEGFDSVLSDWRALNCTLGQDVKVVSREEAFYGIAEDINPDGSLLVRKENGQTENVIAGDVSLRPVN